MNSNSDEAKSIDFLLTLPFSTFRMSVVDSDKNQWLGVYKFHERDRTSRCSEAQSFLHFGDGEDGVGC